MKSFFQLFIIFSCITTSAFAQTKVSGRIIDAEDKAPLGYVTISVPGTNVGVVSDGKGDYSIVVPKGKNTIEFSYVGYNSQTIAVGERTRIDLNLVRSAIQMDEVVVTGFQDIKKQSFTGSSAKLNTKDLEIVGATDVSRMLEGKVAGVSIQNVSSTFGAAPKVRIRGVTSISGENKPLWVVDGVVLEDVVNVSNDQLSSGDPSTLLGSSVAGINANDIETFDILKDAAATALYGARAMNGVVVITTKRGKAGAPVITYNSNYTMRAKPSYSQYNIMNSADQMSVYSELERKGQFSPAIVNSGTSGVYGIMYNAINAYNASNGEYGLENSVEARRAFLYKYARMNTDWFDMLFQNSLMQEHSISISAGSERSRSYASIGFLNDAGWTIADKVNRYTLNFRNDYDVSKKIKLAFGVVGSVRQQKAPGSFSRKADVVTGEYARDFDINPFSYALNTSRALRPYDENGNYEYTTMNFAPFNIMEEIENNTIDLNVADLKLQGEFNYEIIKGLRFNFTGAMRYVKSDQEHMITERSNVANAYRADYNSTIRQANPFLYKNVEDPSQEPVSVLPYGGFYNTDQNRLINYDVRTSLSYSKLWDCGGKTHELNALGGMQIKYTDRQFNNMKGPAYQYGVGGVVALDPRFVTMLVQQQTPMFGMSQQSDRFAAFYANADYLYDRRYSFSATIRYDGSNALGAGANERWLPTWNFGAKWNIAEENFMKHVEAIDFMSIRASYGLTASMPNATNSSAIFYNEQIYRPGNTENSIYLSSLKNGELTWEKSYQFNVGYDLTMFQGRLNVNLDYFRRNSFDLIAPIKVSGVGGQTIKYANYADLESRGYDITIGGKLISKKDFTWSANFTLGFSKNIIKNAKNLPEVFDLVRAEGGNKTDYPVNSLFSIPFAGLDPATGFPRFYDQNNKMTYDIYLQGTQTDFLHHDGQVDPKYTGGLNTTLRWKGLSMNVFFTFAAGNVLRLNPLFSANYNDSRALSNEFKDRWVLPGDERYTNIPSLSEKMIYNRESEGAYPYNNYNYSDVRVAKGDFIRLKSVSINYDLPQKWLTRTKFFKTASVRLTGKDMWLLYSDSALNGQDPEFYNTGGVAMPMQTQFVFSLNLGF